MPASCRTSWRAQSVDRQVQAAIEALFSPDSEMLLVNHIGKVTKDLTVPEIRGSIARCKVELDFPEPEPGDVPPKAQRKPRAKRVAPSSGPAQSSATLADLIAAGVFRAPLDLHRQYKGKMLRAQVRADGRVAVGRQLYEFPSMAGGAARATVIGLRKDGSLPPTNGWTFWRFVGPDGKDRDLDELRQQFLAGGGKAGRDSAAI